jgi:hypothetical protein
LAAFALTNDSKYSQFPELVTVTVWLQVPESSQVTVLGVAASDGAGAVAHPEVMLVSRLVAPAAPQLDASDNVQLPSGFVPLQLLSATIPPALD